MIANSMTKVLSGIEMGNMISDAIPGSVLDSNETDVWIGKDDLLRVSRYLRDEKQTDFSFLTSITAIDYIEYFELVYHLLSMRRNSSLIIKSRCYGRDEELSMPSLVEVWKGADYQEREVWDLMGIRFVDHRNLKRILLWEGFDGHPLRKDYLGQDEVTEDYRE